jgi:site-specific recombinase
MDVDGWLPPLPVITGLDAALRALRDVPPHEPTRRLDALVGVVDWLAEEGGACPLPPGAGLGEGSAWARLWVLVAVLRHRPDDAAVLGALVAATVGEARSVAFLAQTGIAAETRLLGELADRLARKVLPSVDDGVELDGIFAALLPAGRRGLLVDAPVALVEELLALLGQAAPSLHGAWTRFEAGCADAIAVAGLRLATVGLGEDVRQRCTPTPLSMSPFLLLARACDAPLPPDVAPRAAHLQAIAAAVPACRAEVHQVRAGLERGSVSADLVFRLELLERLLQRLELLTAVLGPGPGRTARVLAALGALGEARDAATTVRGLVRSTSRLLARRIVETAGATGEHYIAVDSHEYRRMWWSAAGGGVLMAVVAPVKFLLTWLKLPLFFAGVAAGLNYAAAFVCMQVLGLTLATKQPSMTAAALSGSIGTSHDAGGRAAVVSLIARTTRTQLAAIAGNLGALVPVTILLHFLILGSFGRTFLDHGEADRVLVAHGLTTSGSVVFAALTGVWLWLSSLAAGWADNWVRWRRLPEALRTSRRIRATLGAERAARLATAVDAAAGPFVGNVVIGMLLGLTPAVAGFFGAPIEIRHITISTASVVLAALTLDAGDQHLGALLQAVAGLAGIAAMNFLVSFALALAVALRARDVDASLVGGLLRDVAREALRHPTVFLTPPGDKALINSTKDKMSDLSGDADPPPRA